MPSAYALGALAEAGLQPGTKIPRIELKDQTGTERSFESLRGPQGLLILFNRSADWCSFCKSQLIDLENARKNFEAKGIHVVSITYDSPEVLRLFAQRRGIHYTLLSDPQSKIIDAFGIRNQEAVGSEAGIAIPNYFLIGPDGTITKRHAETGLSDRVTASYFYESLFGVGSALQSSAAIVPDAPHLKIKLLQSDEAAAPGAKVKLAIHLELAKGTHLYAPGADSMGYHSVKLTLDPSTLYESSHTYYPQSTILSFPALGERVPVFESSTTISQDFVAVRSPVTIKYFEANPGLTIHGSLEYQVCTDSTCFPPTKVPVKWELSTRAGDLDLVRVPENLQRK